eukprot:751-Chlamydomonas_euryale.AAC.1
MTDLPKGTAELEYETESQCRAAVRYMHGELLAGVPLSMHLMDPALRPGMGGMGMPPPGMAGPAYDRYDRMGAPLPPAGARMPPSLRRRNMSEFERAKERERKRQQRKFKKDRELAMRVRARREEGGGVINWGGC